MASAADVKKAHQDGVHEGTVLAVNAIARLALGGRYASAASVKDYALAVIREVTAEAEDRDVVVLAS